MEVLENKEYRDRYWKIHKEMNEARGREYKKLMKIYFGEDFELIESESRMAEYVMKRHCAMAALWDVCGLTMETIGFIFGGRDHSTVSYAHKIMTRYHTLKDSKSKAAVMFYDELCHFLKDYHSNGYDGKFIENYIKNSEDKLNMEELRSSLVKQGRSLRLSNKKLVKYKAENREMKIELRDLKSENEMLKSALTKEEIFELRRMKTTNDSVGA